ncbi:redoxin domain-containing protein [Natronomonas sp.]|uniref:redoxin domain-containing protein n=1 Tax=Natronomonas sp. TaxID=2184060 RepID=UPI002FC33E4C
MLTAGDSAPDFTAPMATPENAAGHGEYTAEDVEPFTLSAALSEGPVVLAFFPGAFSRTCTEELCTFRDWRRDLNALDAQVYGVSADTPWSLLAFIEQYDINYPLLSGFNNTVIEDYGMAVDEGIMAGLAGRAVFVVDASGTVIYRWEGDGIRELPEMDAIEAALASL